MPIASKTIGPLHLEDLEPHRFEDLTRQLLYDFKNWHQLEATGRGGSDDGFDIRGYELVSSEQDDHINEDEEDQPSPSNDTVQWLIQCKREKVITPAKLKKYLKDIPKEEVKNLYGVVFVAWCDFSKKSRDAFREEIFKLGIQEAHLWGKAEIEDMLFQPKNDHLLFAYTGISLQSRKRSLKTAVRSNLAIKRKAHRLLHPNQSVLIRDASDNRYPYLDENENLDRIDRGRWIVRTYESLRHNGLEIRSRKHFAYINDEGTEWDYADWINDEKNSSYDDPWDGSEKQNEERSLMHSFWFDLPEQNRAWFSESLVLPFDNIIAIDDTPDDCWPRGVQIITKEFGEKWGPFEAGIWQLLERVKSHYRPVPQADKKKRINVFPKDIEALKAGK